MAWNFVFSLAIVVLCLSNIVFTQAQLFQAHREQELVSKLNRNPQALSLASTDYGHTIHKIPRAVYEPSSISDITDLIKLSYSLPTPFTIAPRGQAHSVFGQPMTSNGIVLNMTHLNNFRNGSGIVVSCDEKSPLGCYVDVGGEQLWHDLLVATLKHGLTPLSLTDYLYATVGGTLSNAGVSGQTFQFGPEISNVLELDVITGKGDFATCSPNKNSEIFYAVLGGLGQFGVITRARIPLAPARPRVKWLHMFYNNFTAFSRDQEHIISFNKRNDINTPEYLEGKLLLNQPPLDLSFYPDSDHQRITSLVTQHGLIYIMELVKYYDNNSQTRVIEGIAHLVKGLNFVPTFKFENDASYEGFVNRVRDEELFLRSKGLWDVPHPWLNLFVPRSRILDFDEGVFKGLILKQNITDGGVSIVYPVNRKLWDNRMSAITPEEDVFYVVSLLHSANQLDDLEKFLVQNQQILQFCKNAGIKISEYLTGNKTRQEWVEHFGPKWKLFRSRKVKFDPKRILSPGQGIFQ